MTPGVDVLTFLLLMLYIVFRMAIVPVFTAFATIGFIAFTELFLPTGLEAADA